MFAVLPFTTSATQIVVLAAAAGIATGFFRPAVYAGLPNLVSDDDLPQANSLLQAVDNLTWALGTIVGGALVAVSSAGRRLLAERRAASSSRRCSWSRIPQRLLQATPADSRGHWRDLADGFSVVVRSRALLTVLIAWNVAMLAQRGRQRRRGRARQVRAFDAGDVRLRADVGCAGVGLAVGAYLAGAWRRAARACANVYGASLGLMAVGVGARCRRAERLGRRRHAS